MSRERCETPVSSIAGVGVANGTFGELLQGALPGDDRHFLVTLPIRRFSKVSFRAEPEHRDLEVHPDRKVKTARLARMLLEHLGLPARGRIEVQSQLPEGKGLASSSADLVATARAIFSSVRSPVEEKTLLHLLRDIEPTDGVMYPELVSFFHRRVELHQRLGLFERPVHVVAIDEGGMVDTVAYNRRSVEYSEEDREEYEELLDRTIVAVDRQDLRTLGEIATRSSEMNQARNPKRHLETMLRLHEDSGALGVVVTHSGPCLGLLFDDSEGHQQGRQYVIEKLASMGFEVLELSTMEPEQVPSVGWDSHPSEASMPLFPQS